MLQLWNYIESCTLKSAQVRNGSFETFPNKGFCCSERIDTVLSDIVHVVTKIAVALITIRSFVRKRVKRFHAAFRGVFVFKFATQQFDFRFLQNRPRLVFDIVKASTYETLGHLAPSNPTVAPKLPVALQFRLRLWLQVFCYFVHTLLYVTSVVAKIRTAERQHRHLISI